MHTYDAMLMALGIPALALLLGLIVLAIINTSRGARSGETPAPSTSSPASPPLLREPPRPGGFEATAGSRLPVWIGGLSLALSGFFLVKYTIEQGLLTVNMRLLLGFVMGLVFIGAAGFVRLRGAADSTRISQALAGAGVSCLYATVYAASGVYETVPPATGFLGLIATTAAAVALSLRYGMGVAVIGLLAGFLLPAFVPVPEPRVLNLFAYLLALTGGLFTAARLRGWWAMGVLALFSGISWVVMWAAGPFFHPDDCAVLGAFLLGSFAVVAVAVPAGFKRPDLSDVAVYLSWLTVAPLMTFVTVRSGYAVDDWRLFGALGFFACIAARFRPLQYRYAPWPALALSLTAVSVWVQQHPAAEPLGAALLVLGAGFGAGAAALTYLQPTIHRAILLTATAFGFYGLGYLHLGADIVRLVPMNADHAWSAIALAIAALFAALALAHRRDTATLHVAGICAAVCAAFVTIAAGIEAPPEYLPALIAGEVLLATLVAHKIPQLRPVAGVLFGLLILREAYVLTEAHILSLLAFRAPDAGLSPLALYGIPAVLLGYSALLTQRQRDGVLPEALEAAVVILSACFIYFGMCHVWGSCRASFTEGVFVTGAFYAAGSAFAVAGRRFSREAYLWCGGGLFFLALFRTLVLDLLMRNPYFTGEAVGDVVLLNGLLLAYGLPILWLWVGQRPQVRMPIQPEVNLALSLILAFTFATLSVRQYFHHPVLNSGVTPHVEIYAYSAVWLILGAILLVVGTKKQDKTLRVTSLLITMFTIAKVFLYDAGALDDLYRVFSFLGLGVSLLALSWFYSRFIFGKKQ